MPHPVKCPSCRKPSTWQDNPYRPFCSARCRTIDLGAWADESYKIPAAPSDPLVDPLESDPDEADQT